MAKWLFATLLSVNAGGLVLSRDAKHLGTGDYFDTLAFFVGLVSAVVSGAAIYFNLEQLEWSYRQHENAKMLVSLQYYKAHEDGPWVGRTHAIGVTFSAISLLCFIIGGAIIACVDA